MKLTLLPALCLLGSALSAPIKTAKQRQQQADTATLIRQSWAQASTAYQEMEKAIQTINPAILINGVSLSAVPAAHAKIMDVMTRTAAAARGRKEVSGAIAGTLGGPAVNLAKVKVAAINAVIRAKPVIVNTRERVNVYNMLVQQANVYAEWNVAFNKLMPNGQKGAGNAISKQVTDAYKKAVMAFMSD